MKHDHPAFGSVIPPFLSHGVPGRACGLIVLCALVAIAADQEPSYNGRLLSQWLGDMVPGGLSTGHAPYEEAIRAMGTNAIPTLLKWISYEPSPSEQASLTERTLPSAVGPDHTLSPAERAVRAHYAFCSLGAAARPAIPELARMVRTSADPKRAERCAYSLAGIGPEAIPSLLSLATNGPPLTRRCAIDALEPFARDPVATLIVPVLIRCLDDTNDPIVGAAQRVLINVNSAVVVPALTNALQSPSTRIRLRVVQCAFLLEAFIDPRQPSEAPTMVSALRAAMRDPDYEVRAAATNTLREVGGWQLVGEQWVRRHGTNTLYGITPDFFTNGPPR